MFFRNPFKNYYIVFYTFQARAAVYKASCIISYFKLRVPDIPSIEELLKEQGYQNITLEGMCKL